jgi:oligopeptide/dipeptide ABC transporter ATP-binding protein
VTQSNQPGPLLELRQVTKDYHVRDALLRRTTVQALKGVDLEVHANRTVCLIGETGSGKTTLGRIMTGVTTPDAGDVLFRGRSLSSLDRAKRREYRRSVQMVFQSPTASFNPMLTIGASIRDAARFADPRPADLSARVGELLHRMGLPKNYAGRYPNEVSGGELQRASIARALATDPAVVFLDEPASALDVSIRGQIFNLLLDLQGELRLAYVMVTHDLATVRVLAQDVLVLYLGKAVEYARDGQFRQPRHPYSLALLRAAPGEAERSHLGPLALRGEAPSVTHPPPGCPFHPRCWLNEQLKFPNRCRELEPRLEPVSAAQAVACHYAELSAEAATDSRFVHESALAP